jgi:hypothetical protein
VVLGWYWDYGVLASFPFQLPQPYFGYPSIGEMQQIPEIV